jgi:hypothetical protein
MKNLKTVVFTVAIMTMATIGSYAQSKVDGKMEKFMLLFRGGDTHPQTANDSKEAMEYIQFIASKEMVNGYLIIIAKDIDEAVEIAKGCPIFKENGKVEVRPVQKLEN